VAVYCVQYEKKTLSCPTNTRTQAALQKVTTMTTTNKNSAVADIAAQSCTAYFAITMAITLFKVIQGHRFLCKFLRFSNSY